MSPRPARMSRRQLAALGVAHVVPHRPATIGANAAIAMAQRRTWTPVEHNLQVAYFAWVVTDLEPLYPGINDDIYAIPNGVRVGKRQASKLKREGLRAGRPDISIDRAHGGWFGMRLESKPVGGSPSASQKKIIARLVSQGFYAVVGRGLDQMQELTLAYLAWPATRAM